MLSLPPGLLPSCTGTTPFMRSPPLNLTRKLMLLKLGLHGHWLTFSISSRSALARLPSPLSSLGSAFALGLSWTCGSLLPRVRTDLFGLNGCFTCLTLGGLMVSASLPLAQPICRLVGMVQSRLPSTLQPNLSLLTRLLLSRLALSFCATRAAEESPASLTSLPRLFFGSRLSGLPPLQRKVSLRVPCLPVLSVTGFRRDLVFLSTGLQTESLSRGCQCVRKHLTPSSGSSGKVFGLPLGSSLCSAVFFSKGLSSRRAAILCSDISIAGLERIAVNDLAQSLPWETDCSWRWPREVHINILEASVLCRLYKRLALEYGRCRFVNLCDSFVALSALGKGRSSSDSLRHAARRSSMTCLAAGLYPGNLYTPTRFMPADHPTRDQEFPPRVDGFGLDFWTSDAIFADATRPRLKRWASSWVRAHPPPLSSILCPCVASGEPP